MIGEPKCSYKQCNHKSHAAFEVEIGDQDGMRMRLPFCKYHWFIMSSDKFKVMNVKEKDGKFSYDTIGPFEEIALIEQVIAGKIIATDKEKWNELVGLVQKTHQKVKG